MSQGSPDSDLGFDGIGKRISKPRLKPKTPESEKRRDQLSSETLIGEHSSSEIEVTSSSPRAAPKLDYSDTLDSGVWVKLKDHAKLIVVLVIVGVVIVGLLNDNQKTINKGDSSYQVSRPPQELYSSPPSQPLIFGKYDETINNLRSKIETGRSQIKMLELKINTMATSMTKLKENIANYKTEIEYQEQQARLGLNIDESLYHNNIDEHNRLVRQFNNTLSVYKSTYDEYDKMVEQDKIMVKEHNDLLKLNASR